MPGQRTVERVSTGIEGLDEVLGGGLPRQSLVTVAGVPGTGKSTLVFHMLARVARGHRGLYVSTTQEPSGRITSRERDASFRISAMGSDDIDVLELRPEMHEGGLYESLNIIARSLDESGASVLAIDSFSTLSEIARSRSEVWRFLGELSRQLIAADCIGILVGEYVLPMALGLPEFAVADVVLHLEVERQVRSDLRTLRVYKLRGGNYLEGRSTFVIDERGIRFAG